MNGKVWVPMVEHREKHGQMRTVPKWEFSHRSLGRCARRMKRAQIEAVEFVQFELTEVARVLPSEVKS